MKRYFFHSAIQLLAVHIPLVFTTTCFGQGWLDYARSALPRVNVPTSGQPQFPTTNPFPSSNPIDPSFANPGQLQPGFPTSTGFGTTMVPSNKDWKLGVYVDNTEVGALVTQVSPGSPGQIAGLEPNDIIIAVGGSRIGRFDNRVVELANELRRNADNMGRVSLLVMDARQGRLQSIPVSMNATSTSLIGQVMTRDRAQLPFGSVLIVQLQNASKPYYEIAGGKSVTQAGGGTMGFELNVDPRFIDPRDQYQLVAAITSGGQEIYRVQQPIPVNPNALGQPVQLVLERSMMQSGTDFGSSGGFAGTSGSVVSVGYPGTLDTNGLNQLFMQLLGRSPSNREAIAWQQYLQQGNSINDLKAKLLSNPQYRERFASESAYLQQAILSATNRAPSQQELAYWLTRLQSTQSPELVMTEILQKAR